MQISGQFTLTAIEDSLHLELTSSSAVMVYDSKGVLLSGAVTTTATLYRGASAIASGVTYSLGTKSGVTATISGSTITVTAMSANAGYVEVQAKMGSNVYKVRFVVNKMLKPIDGRTDTMIVDAGHVTHIKGGSYTPAVINIEHVRFEGGEKVVIPTSEQWRIIASAIVSYTNSDGEVELDYAGWDGSETSGSNLTLDLAAAEADIKENYYPDAEIQSIELQLGEFNSGVGTTHERKAIAVTNITKYRRLTVPVGNKFLHIEDGIVIGYDSSQAFPTTPQLSKP